MMVELDLLSRERLGLYDTRKPSLLGETRDVFHNLGPGLYQFYSGSIFLAVFYKPMDERIQIGYGSFFELAHILPQGFSAVWKRCELRPPRVASAFHRCLEECSLLGLRKRFGDLFLQRVVALWHY